MQFLKQFFQFGQQLVKFDFQQFVKWFQ